MGIHSNPTGLRWCRTFMPRRLTPGEAECEVCAQKGSTAHTVHTATSQTSALEDMTYRYRAMGWLVRVRYKGHALLGFESEQRHEKLYTASSARTPPPP